MATEKPMDEVRARLAAIVESSDDAIISKDLNGVITSWNRGAERIFGYTAAEAIGRSITMLIPPERQDEEPGILARVRRGERIDHYETVRQRKDGTRLGISLTVSPMLDEHGTVIGASKIARDITERQELLRIAEQARDQAEAANRAKDEFLAMLGHELRNPLSAVQNALAVATRDPASGAHALAIAHRQTQQLGRIVDDLLDVSRITHGRVPLRRAWVALGEIVKRTVEASRAILDERGHRLELAVTDDVHVDADAARLEQAVGNLLSNAAKYTAPGGTVTVTAGREGDEAVVRVRDDGLGIAPDVLPRIFDLFTQGTRSLARSEGGLGVGLTVVRRIVELHGGTVTAASAGLDTGTEFVIRLPALPPGAPAPRADGGAPAAAHAGAAHVLIVEDNPDAAESLCMLLELLGHRVSIAHDGTTALAAVRVEAPDVMLVDIGLPGMDGYEVARAVRRDVTSRGIALVALTGYGQAEDKAAATQAGFDRHLVKPVDAATLGELVTRLARDRRGA